MRISDDRYSRDRFRLDLALRFMRHEARTHTIRKWTGLTDDRIRKLYKAYLEQTPGQQPVYRHRGKSPAQACYFIRTPRVQQESAVLASLYCMLGALPASPETEPPTPGVVRGERLCQAFEAYLTFVQSAQITFEHAVLLINELARGVEIKLDDCTICGGLLVVDGLALRDIRCSRCSEQSQAGC